MVKYILYLAAILAGLWAGVPDMVKVLLVVMACDIITGSVRAGLEHNLTADKAFRGVTKKAIVLLIVSMVYYFDKVIGTGLGAAIAGFYAASEGVSMVDNAIALGVPVPDFIKELFKQWAVHGSQPLPTQARIEAEREQALADDPRPVLK